jgi:hypothetical protein
MRTTVLAVLLISTTARAGDKLPPDDLPGPQPEVAKHEPRVDPPPVPAFDLPAVEPGFHGPRELRVRGMMIGIDLTISGTVDPATAMNGTVTLNGKVLTYGTDWTVVNGTTIHLVGQACTDLQSSASPMVDASFPCGGTRR